MPLVAFHTNLGNVQEPPSDTYTYTASLLELERLIAPSGTVIPAEAANIVTPLKAAAWKKALATHPDQSFAKYIVEGITQGFHIGFNWWAYKAKGAQTNMRSAMEYPGPVNDYLKTELAAGRIAKLDKETRHMVIVNRVGVI